jgi:hypothetical protein
MEFWDRINDVEDCNIGSCLCQALGKGKTTSSSSSGHQGGAAFEGKLTKVSR